MRDVWSFCDSLHLSSTQLLSQTHMQVSVLLSTFLVVTSLAVGFKVSGDTTTVLHVSDIHLDPYYGTSKATEGISAAN